MSRIGSACLFSHVGTGKWGMKLVESWEEAGSGPKLIASLQLYSKGQSSHIFLQSQRKRTLGSTFNENRKWFVSRLGELLVSSGGRHRKTEVLKDPIPRKLCTGNWGSTVCSLVPGPQTLQESLPIITYADWKFTFGLIYERNTTAEEIYTNYMHI